MKWRVHTTTKMLCSEGMSFNWSKCCHFLPNLLWVFWHIEWIFNTKLQRWLLGTRSNHLARQRNINNPNLLGQFLGQTGIWFFHYFSLHFLKSIFTIEKNYKNIFKCALNNFSIYMKNQNLNRTRIYRSREEKCTTLHTSI